MILDFKTYKLFESLPRQSTVDQLKRIREEIKKSRDIKIGPVAIKNGGGDIGDKVTSDLKKHQQNNLFWWDNPIDRKIDSYEDFIENDNKKGLGYV